MVFLAQDMCYIWHTECLEQTLFFQWWAGMASQPQPTGINSILLETSSLSFFFLTPLLFLKRELSETSDFCLLLPISCPFCGSVVQPQYGAEGWCQVRGNRPLYSLAGASGTPVGKTFSLKILLGLAPMLWMCHSKEAPHFNLLYSLFVDFFFIPDITSCTFILSPLLFSEDNNPNLLWIATPLILLVALWVLWSSQSLRWLEMAGPQQSA